MIQRKQSLYLLLIAVLAIVLFFVPVIDLYIDHIRYPFEILKGFLISDHVSKSLRHVSRGGFSSPVILFVVTFLSFINIFLYKKRKVQIKVCYIIMVLIFVMFFCIFYDSCFLYKHSITDYKLTVASVFPIVMIILDILAILGIRKDEKLVNSLDRIR